MLNTKNNSHDYKCIYNFQENDIYIPITVLEELDKFKKGNDDINFNAREFSRDLDLLADNPIFTKGVSLGDKLGKLFIVTSYDYPEALQQTFAEKTPDHRILAVAYQIQKQYKNTILVSKDINLRLKAKSLGINTEDYISDKVTSADIFDKKHVTGCRIVALRHRHRHFPNQEHQRNLVCRHRNRTGSFIAVTHSGIQQHGFLPFCNRSAKFTDHPQQFVQLLYIKGDERGFSFHSRCTGIHFLRMFKGIYIG